jgi:hypothetical protein
MDTEIPDDLIEIHDSETSPTLVIEQIRERMRKRREELGYEQHGVSAFGATDPLGGVDDIPQDCDLYYPLRMANEIYAQVETTAILVPSPATRVPILGRLWKLVRQEFHNLILFYVNRSNTHQTNVNRYLISALNQLTVLSQEQQRIITLLQKEIQALRQQEEDSCASP